MRQLEYDSVMSLRFSDHRPVYAIFEMGIRVVDEEKKDMLTKKLYTKRARETRVKAGDSTEVFDEIETDDETESIMESVMGYESIQEGLPPASSDKKKWWLDGNKGARSTIRPPRDGIMLSKDREGNPWKESAEDDWVEVERPPIMDNVNRSRSRVESLRRPEPPTSRSFKRMLPPPWEGERNPTSTSTVTMGARSPSSSPTVTMLSQEMKPMPRRPSPPSSLQRSSSAATSPTHSPGVPARSSSAAGFKKQPPPKPSKPSALTSQIAVPQPSTPPAPIQSKLANVSRSPEVVAVAAADADETPPPLPRRKETASSTASFASAPDAMSSPPTGARTISKGPAPLPPAMRTIKPAQQQHMARNDGANETTPGPPLPPRRDGHAPEGNTTLPLKNGGKQGPNLGLMDEDDSSGVTSGGLDRYKPLVPR